MKSPIKLTAQYVFFSIMHTTKNTRHFRMRYAKFIPSCLGCVGLLHSVGYGNSSDRPLRSAIASRPNTSGKIEKNKDLFACHHCPTLLATLADIFTTLQTNTQRVMVWNGGGGETGS